MTADRSLPLLSIRQWRMLGGGMAALHERERAKPEKDRLFSLDEIEELHKLVFGQWVEAHGIKDWEYYDTNGDGP